MPLTILNARNSREKRHASTRAWPKYCFLLKRRGQPTTNNEEIHMSKATVGLFFARAVSAFMVTLGCAAQAAPITWNLSNVGFADGGTASGSFQYDADTGSYSNIAITTTQVASFGATYGTPNPVNPGNASLLLVIADLPPLAIDLTGTPALALSFTSPLTNLGGTSDIISRSLGGFSFESTCSLASCSVVSGSTRDVVSGQVTTNVPAPATAALLSLALVGGALARRRS